MNKNNRIEPCYVRYNTYLNIYLSYYRPTKFGLHAYNCLETALGKLACEVRANDARLGLKELNQVLQGFNN